MPTGYYEKNKEKLQKEARKRYLKKRKAKSNNMLMKGTKIFLKMKKTKSKNIVVNVIKIFLNVKNKS